LQESDILEILQQLRLDDSTSGNPVYVSGGGLYAIGPGGTVARREDEAAGPYLWPIAHDVRPKAQSLGVRGCTDCHATDAPFHFGTVIIASPYVLRPDSTNRMTAYQDKSPVSVWVFSMSFLFRPGLKVMLIVCFALIASVVLMSMLRGFAHIIRTLAAEEE
jgi:hypothetical protein